MAEVEAKGTRPQKDVSRQEVAKAEKALEETLRSSNEVLVSVSTVWPFHLFPDTITVDREKVTVTRRLFMGARSERSIRLEDIIDVTADNAPLFGAIHIVVRGMNPDKVENVNYLWREDAMALKRILHGFVILMQKRIDLSVIKSDELLEMIDRIGSNEDTHAE